jgi:hypothetical protein
MGFRRASRCARESGGDQGGKAQIGSASTGAGHVTAKKINFARLLAESLLTLYLLSKA